MPVGYTKPEKISMKSHPDYNEKWVQNIIADDPSVLGLGDLVLRDKERIQPRAGRLDLLLQDRDTKRRYEVELQLGSTDESHIIRSIEYWDIERKRYPNYDHCAVLIAEDVTSRFLNVISLFNGLVPFVAIQLQAIKIGESVTLIFTKVLDEFSRMAAGEDEDADAVPADRSYWEQKSPKEMVALADDLLQIVRKIDQELILKYNKVYIGLAKGGRPFNFITFRPRRKHIIVEIKIPQSDETTNQIEQAGFETMDYDQRWGNYRLQLDKEDIDQNSEKLLELMKLAYDRKSS